MGVQVTFSYPSFINLFPEFQNVDEGSAQSWFDVAGATICRNDGFGPVSNANTQTALMNFATAHLIYLFTPQVNGQSDTESPSSVPAPNLVGRIQSATEGSVTVSTDMPQPPSGTAAWWLQTKYGALWWQMTSVYRTMRYIPGRQRWFGPGYGAPGFQLGGTFNGGFGCAGFLSFDGAWIF